MLTCGLDFGTSNSLAAVARDGDVRLCPVDPANLDPHLLPSLLFFSRYGRRALGRAATHAYQAEPDGRFIRSLKSALPEYPSEDEIRVFENRYRLPDLVRMLLSHIRDRLREALGADVTALALGRPVRFSADPAADRRAEGILREAALAAGFTRVRFMPEPEAAMRYYYAREGAARGETVLVFDFGGGTLDLCVAEFGPRGCRVLGTAGVSIGGSLLDRILFERLIRPHLGFGRRWGANRELPQAIYNRLINPDAAWRVNDIEYAREVREILNASIAAGTVSRELRQFHAVVDRRMGPDIFAAIEAAKMRLADVEATEIRFEAGEVRIREPLTRADLRALFTDELAAIAELVHDTLRAAGRRVGEIDRVLLAGGSSALFCTQELLWGIFGRERVPVREDLFTSIVSGLALSAEAA